MRSKMWATSLLWLPLLANAGTNTWTAMGPAGATLKVLAFGDSEGLVFAAGSSGLYRSLDSGAHWQFITSAFVDNAPTGMAVDPADASRLYVIAPPFLYVSTDGGATLQTSSSLPATAVTPGQVAVSHDGETLYLASTGQIYRSSDRGATWVQKTPISADPAAMPIDAVVDPTNPNSLYVSIQLSTAALNEVVATHDGGMTWQVLLSESDDYGPAPALAVNPANPLQLWLAGTDGLATSMDQGVTWTFVAGLIQMAAVTLDPENASSVYAVSAGGVISHSADNGAHWTSANPGTSAGLPHSIAVDPAQGARILVAGDSGVAGSSDSGITWSAQDSGMLSSNVAGLSGDPTSGLIYAESPTQGIYSATTEEATFQPVNNDGLYSLSFPGASSQGMTLDISAFLGLPGSLRVSLPTGLATSQDGGDSWTLSQVVPARDGTPQLFVLAGSAAAPQTVLAASLDQLYRTVDGGGIWSSGDGLPVNDWIGSLLVAPSNAQVAYTLPYDSATGVIAGIYRTTDGGLSWTPASATVPAGIRVLTAVDPTSPGTLYGATDTTLLKSTDSGSTWSSVTSDVSLMGGAPDLLIIDSVHPQILIAARAAGVARSVDGGANWEMLNPAMLSEWGITSLLLDPKRPESLFVATFNTGVQQITIAPDLSVTGDPPAGPIAIDAPVTFSLTAANQGPFAATDVTVNVTLPAGTLSAVATATGATCTASASTASCKFPFIKAGGNATVTVTANGIPVGEAQIVASIAGDQPDANQQNNSITLAASIEAASTPAVTVTAKSSGGGGGGLSGWDLVALSLAIAFRRWPPAFRREP